MAQGADGTLFITSATGCASKSRQRCCSSSKTWAGHGNVFTRSSSSRLACAMRCTGLWHATDTVGSGKEARASSPKVPCIHIKGKARRPCREKRIQRYGHPPRILAAVKMIFCAESPMTNCPGSVSASLPASVSVGVFWYEIMSKSEWMCPQQIFATLVRAVARGAMPDAEDWLFCSCGTGCTRCPSSTARYRLPPSCGCLSRAA